MNAIQQIWKAILYPLTGMVEVLFPESYYEVMPKKTREILAHPIDREAYIKAIRAVRDTNIPQQVTLNTGETFTLSYNP